MDARVQKLQRLGLEQADAAALVQAGFDTPAKIRGANDKDLPKVGKKVRVKFPKRKAH